MYTIVLVIDDILIIDLGHLYFQIINVGFFFRAGIAIGWIWSIQVVVLYVGFLRDSLHICLCNQVFILFLVSVILGISLGEGHTSLRSLKASDSWHPAAVILLIFKLDMMGFQVSLRFGDINNSVYWRYTCPPHFQNHWGDLGILQIACNCNCMLESYKIHGVGIDLKQKLATFCWTDLLPNLFLGLLVFFGTIQGECYVAFKWGVMCHHIWLDTLSWIALSWTLGIIFHEISQDLFINVIWSVATIIVGVELGWIWVVRWL